MQNKPLTWLVTGMLLIAGLLAATNSTTWGQGRELPAQPQSWEYHVEEISVNYHPTLNHLGSQGWELVTASPVRNPPSNTLFVFKRRKN